MLEYVDAKLKPLTEFGDKISLSYLLGKEEGLRENEIEQFIFAKNLKQNVFVSQLKSEIKNNSKVLTHLIDKLNVNKKSINDENVINYILDNIASEHLEIYVPYKELENTVNEDFFYVSYEPSYFTKTNEAYKFTNTQYSKTLNEPVAVEINDDFIEDNKTYIVKPMDPCDKLNYRSISGDDCFSEGSGEPGPGGPLSPPDPLDDDNLPKLLTQNVDHTTVEQKDILSTRLRRFRVKGKKWLGFGATHQKLELHRGSADGKVKIENGIIIPEANTYKVADLKITRRAAKEKLWRDANTEFDDDWNLSENEQAFFIFSKHHLKASASAELTIKAGFKLEDGEPKPSAERTITTKVKVEVSAAKFREKRALSRRQVLVTIVGTGVTGEEVWDEVDNVNYNVKQAGIFEYTLRHYYTDID